jgi:hexosaminidase
MAPPDRHFQCGKKGSCLPLPIGTKSGLSQGECELTCGAGSVFPKPSGTFTFSEKMRPVDRNSFSFNTEKANPGAQTMLQDAGLRFLNQITKSPRYDEVNRRRRVGGTSLPVLVSYIVADADTKLDMETDESYTIRILETACKCDGKSTKPCQHSVDGTCFARGGNGMCTSGTMDCAQGSILNVAIKAKNYFGARHALETFSQLVVYDELKSTLAMPSSAVINDAPAYPYRGLLIDTARHFLPTWMIKKVISGMAANKLNRLHLHVTDTASFPLALALQPNMSRYGAYSAREMYTAADITDLVSFGRAHGVQLIPEVDAPAHANAGWEWGPEAGLGELVLCTGDWSDKALEPPGGQMNIVNENLYKVLGDIFDNVAEMFDSSIWHLGGDEVLVGSDESWGGCWNRSDSGKPIVDYIEKHGLDRHDKQTFYTLWKTFTTRAHGLVRDAYKKHNVSSDKMMQWGGAGTGGEPVIYNLFGYDDIVKTLPPSEFMIQVWDSVKGSIAPKLAKEGYDIVLSHSDYMYLDCGESGWAQPGGYWCGPYHEWYKMYDYIPDVIKEWSMSEKDAKMIKGAEAAIWGEQADMSNIEVKIWPRASALAERLWSNPTTNWYAADPRMQLHRERMVQRNISAEPLQTQWCINHGAYACTLNSSHTPVFQGEHGTGTHVLKKNKVSGAV